MPRTLRSGAPARIEFRSPPHYARALSFRTTARDDRPMFDPELLQKRAELIQAGVNPYPYSFERSHHLAEVRAKQG